MAAIVDSSLWVEFLRSGSSRERRVELLPIFERDDIVLCEPVRLEILGFAPAGQRKIVRGYFETLPTLKSPPSLWRDADILAQRCVDGGMTPAPMDILIAQVALHHGVAILTTDRHFEAIAKVAPLEVILVGRT